MSDELTIVLLIFTGTAAVMSAWQLIERLKAAKELKKQNDEAADRADKENDVPKNS